MSGARLTAERALGLLLREQQARGQRPSTADQGQRTLRRLLPRLGRPLARATPADVEALLAARLNEVGAGTVSRELSCLRLLYRVLLDAGLVAHDPTRSLRVERGAPRRVFLSEDAVQLVLAESSRPPPVRRSPSVRRALGLRNRAALELLYGLAVRVSEACALRLFDLDLAGGSLLARRSKGGETASLPLTPAMVPHLERYLVEGRPALLATRDESRNRLLVNERGRPLTRGHLWRLVTGIAARVGVEAHPHALRRSLATQLVQRGAGLPAVQRLLGHASLDTTQRYVLVRPDDLRAAVETLETCDNPGRARPTVRGKHGASPDAP